MIAMNGDDEHPPGEVAPEASGLMREVLLTRAAECRARAAMSQRFGVRAALIRLAEWYERLAAESAS